MLSSERPKPSHSKRRRIFEGGDSTRRSPHPTRRTAPSDASYRVNAVAPNADHQGRRASFRSRDGFRR
jgi:hypothetical protein